MLNTNHALRLPEFVSLDVTYSCNLRCVHCYNNSGEREYCGMEHDALIDTARQIAELHPCNVCVCGGEPLCCPWLEEVITVLKSGVQRVSMVSNGYAMTEENAKMLKACGVDAIQISLDGAYAWQHDTLRGVPGAFEHALLAVKRLKAAGLDEVYTSIIPNVLNCESMEDYTRLCIELGIKRVRSMPFLASGRGSTVGRGLMLDDAGYFRFRRELSRLRRIYGEQVFIEWDDPLENIAPSSRSGSIKSMCIFADGSIAASIYLPVTLGNVRRHSLREYWYGGCFDIWQDPRLVRYAAPLTNLSALDELDPPPHGDERIELDILEDRP